MFFPYAGSVYVKLMGEMPLPTAICSKTGRDFLSTNMKHVNIQSCARLTVAIFARWCVKSDIWKPPDAAYPEIKLKKYNN